MVDTGTPRPKGLVNHHFPRPSGVRCARSRCRVSGNLVGRMVIGAFLERSR